MVETRSGVAVEPEGSPHVEKGHKEGGAGGRATGIAARAGPARTGRWSRGVRIGGVELSAAQLYTVLGLLHASLAVPLIFAWEATSKAAFGELAAPPEQQHGHLLRIYAAGLASSAAVAFALEELARLRMLHSFTADVLKMGLIAHGLAWFSLMLIHPASLNLLAGLVEGMASLATAALPASHLLATAEDRQRVSRGLKDLPGAASSFLVHRGRGRMPALYTVQTIAFMASGAAYLLAPRFTLIHVFGYDYGQSAQLLWQAIGAGALLTVLPAVSIALKHKADRDYMTTSVARTLNVGLLITAVGHLLVLGAVMFRGNGGFLLPAVVGTWLLSLVTSVLGLGAPDLAQQLAESVSEAAKHE